VLKRAHSRLGLGRMEDLASLSEDEEENLRRKTRVPGNRK
jgi:hypothetical protein